MTDDGASERGWLFAIGGGEEKEEDESTLRRYLAVAGGHGARILLIELTSGADAGRGAVLKNLLAGLGAHVDALHSGDDGEIDSGGLERLAGSATGFYLVATNPRHAMTVIDQNRLGDWIVTAARSGRAVAASGGGAAILGEHVLHGAEKGASPYKGSVSFGPGLGLIPGTVFDPSRTPARIGRLLAAVAQSPFHLGIGVDDGAVAVFAPGGVVEAHGSGAVTLVDGSWIGYSDYFALKDQEPIGLTGARVHFLKDGMSYLIPQRAFLHPECGKPRKRLSAEAEARALSQ
jgi:cyanophycinase